MSPYFVFSGPFDSSGIDTEKQTDTDEHTARTEIIFLFKVNKADNKTIS